MVERPLECIGCNKAIHTIYKEIKEGHLSSCCMCEECPVLKQKLYGFSAEASLDSAVKTAGLCCSKCGTTLDSAKRGELLGCSECYQVFDDFLAESLVCCEKIPENLKKEIRKKNYSLHLGKTPKRAFEAPTSSKLAGLIDALNDAIKKENYEQAAWLRDQISAIKDKNDGRA